MSKIEKLTDAQEAAMPLYVDKWIKIGTSTEPTNRGRAIKNVIDYYKVAKLSPPKTVVFATSPLAAQVLGSLLTNDAYIEYAAFGKGAIEETAKSLAAILTFENTEAAPRFFTQLATTAVSAAQDLTKALKVKPIKNTKMPKLNIEWSTVCGGNLWAGWQAFYDFFKTEVKVEGLDIIEPTIALSADIGWIIPFENVVILTEKPNALHLNAAGQIHKDGGAALQYSDGYSIYALNGTVVPRYMAVTEALNLDPKQVLQETNVEVRLQGVKKIGPAKLIEQLGAQVISSQAYEAGGQYELLSVNWTGSERRYLKMINPSTGETCIEPVHPECSDVNQALGFRASSIVGETWQDKQYVYKAPKLYT